ncbi:metabolism of cobalamin associated Db isoform X2 [Phycodurus eques]|uniref:metabolism of cobalamin associated Db isoform X2 n=1 Tax=Phycodurus eques TaxID=693459 RepID=UPI002ACD4F45|nr:metabolism of cobalamin associated Db isoform X2 [Phycodurus eques]XP_061547677.1 metabolism of cobalamin associated Db isoform X2 [Phycodurus eques]
MAAVLYSRSRLATYLPGLNALVQHIASTMGFATSGSDGSVAMATSINGPLTLRHDENKEPFGVKDQLYFMPGNMGFECHLQGSEQKTRLIKKMVPDLLPTPSSPEKCMSGLLINEFFDDPTTNHNTNKEINKESVECLIQSCPEKLKQDLKYLFPEAPSSHVTVVTVTQKTKNDMTAWCSAVEEERDHMLDKFVDGAKEICFILQREGFWADFIDPSSGLAFFGPFTNNTLFETDDRYRLLGFQIEDLGCCKVIRHPLWGAHAFVGIIFTNAPPGSLVMENFQGF